MLQLVVALKCMLWNGKQIFDLHGIKSFGMTPLPLPTNIYNTLCIKACWKKGSSQKRKLLVLYYIIDKGSLQLRVFTAAIADDSLYVVLIVQSACRGSFDWLLHFFNELIADISHFKMSCLFMLD